MKAKTRAWIEFAQRDLAAGKKLAGDDYLGGAVAYHSQQCIEKCLKAVLEEAGVSIPKTHSSLYLLQAIRTIRPDFTAGIDEDDLAGIDDIYTDVRYPGSRGILPWGMPTAEQAAVFLAAAESVFSRTASDLS